MAHIPIPNPQGAAFTGFLIAAGGTPRPSADANPHAMASALGTHPHAINKMEIHDLSRLNHDDDPGLPKFLLAHFNPKEVKKTIRVVWNEIPIPGLSHKKLQYHLTENVPFKFDLHFDTLQTLSIKPYQIRGNETQIAANFLESLCYPKAGAQNVQDGAPPRVLFYWPNFLSLTCVVTEQEWTYTMFHTDGTPRQFTCSLSLKEIRDVRLTSSMVLNGGLKRNSPHPPTADLDNVLKVGG